MTINIFQNNKYLTNLYSFGKYEYQGYELNGLIEVTNYLIITGETKEALLDISLDRLICGDHPDDLASYLTEAYGVDLDNFFASA